jgi:hypothetical protein
MPPDAGSATVVDHDPLHRSRPGLLCVTCNNYIDQCLHVTWCPWADYLNALAGGAAAAASSEGRWRQAETRRPGPRRIPWVRPVPAASHQTA